MPHGLCKSYVRGDLLAAEYFFSSCSEHGVWITRMWLVKYYFSVVCNIGFRVVCTRVFVVCDWCRCCSFQMFITLAESHRKMLFFAFIAGAATNTKKKIRKKCMCVDLVVVDKFLVCIWGDWKLSEWRKKNENWNETQSQMFVCTSEK